MKKDGAAAKQGPGEFGLDAAAKRDEAATHGIGEKIVDDRLPGPGPRQDLEDEADAARPPVVEIDARAASRRGRERRAGTGCRAAPWSPRG